jgi:outer membrane protein assembly factor BamB
LQGEEKKKPATKSPTKKTKAKKSDSIALGSTSGEWHQWRGPNRDGISQERGLLDQWPEGGPPLLWKVGGLGSGYSSVAIADGKIFTIGRLGGKDKLIALSLPNGEPLWTADAGSGGPNPNGTPTVAGNLVYCVTCGGDLLCADTATGKEVWRKNFPRDFNGKMMSGWGYSESVLVDGDHVICTPGSPQAMLAALDKQTGNVIWTTSVSAAGSKGSDGAAYSSPVISNAAGIKQYVQLVGRGVIGVDANTGELLWGYNDIANGTANIPTPIVQGDYVFCSTGYSDGGSALLKLTGSRGRITPQVVYSYPANKMQNHHGGMVLVGKYLYMGHGHNNGFPLCVEFLTGKEMWRPGRGPGGGSAAVTYADGHLYFRYQDGVMALIQATPEAYRLKGQFRIAIKHGESWPHPVVAGGRLYLRDQSELVCYDVSKK